MCHRPKALGGCNDLQPLATVRDRAATLRIRARDPSPGSEWRNRDEFLKGREEITSFLTRKWEREHDYVLRKDLWAFTDDRIAVRFQYEWHDDAGNWFRSYGNELWEFDAEGYMCRREASINDVPIAESDRRLFGPRADGDDDGIPLR